MWFYRVRRLHWLDLQQLKNIIDLSGEKGEGEKGRGERGGGDWEKGEKIGWKKSTIPPPPPTYQNEVASKLCQPDHMQVWLCAFIPPTASGLPSPPH